MNIKKIEMQERVAAKTEVIWQAPRRRQAAANQAEAARPETA